VFDITIDALALHFLLKIDDDLVNEGDLNSIFSYQKRELHKLKTQTKLTSNINKIWLIYLTKDLFRPSTIFPWYQNALYPLQVLC